MSIEPGPQRRRRCGVTWPFARVFYGGRHLSLATAACYNPEGILRRFRDGSCMRNLRETTLYRTLRQPLGGEDAPEIPSEPAAGTRAGERRPAAAHRVHNVLVFRTRPETPLAGTRDRRNTGTRRNNQVCTDVAWRSPALNAIGSSPRSPVPAFACSRSSSLKSGSRRPPRQRDSGRHRSYSALPLVLALPGFRGAPSPRN